jgi:hypothetical protein
MKLQISTLKHSLSDISVIFYFIHLCHSLFTRLSSRGYTVLFCASFLSLLPLYINYSDIPHFP